MTTGGAFKQTFSQRIKLNLFKGLFLHLLTFLWFGAGPFKVVQTRLSTSGIKGSKRFNFQQLIQGNLLKFHKIYKI